MKPVRVLVVALVVALVAALSTGRASTAAPTTHISVGSESTGVNRLHLGVTHTEHSADSWGNRTAVDSARTLLREASLFQNQHIMGWGAGSPEPWPGVYDWRSLDARVRLMRETSAKPMITFAAAPDWMKGGLPGITNWSRIEAAPTPAFYDEFARLAQRVALRYPDVRHFQVWNELKGFWDPVKNRWRFEEYTRLYNAVYEAVKSVRPDSFIGGPYVVVDSWSTADEASHPAALRGHWGVADQRALDVIDYWLANKRGADFIAIDGSTRTRDAGLTTDPFAAAQKFVDVTRWVRSRTDLPIVWSEWRASPDSTDPTRRVAIAANALGATAYGGAAGVLLWQPQGEGAACNVCLWTDTRRTGGGLKAPMYDIVAAFNRAFPPGTVWKRVRSSSPTVGVLASDGALMLVNRTPTVVMITGLTGVSSLQPHEVRFVER